MFVLERASDVVRNCGAETFTELVSAGVLPETDNELLYDSMELMPQRKEKPDPVRKIKLLPLVNSFDACECSMLTSPLPKEILPPE